MGWLLSRLLKACAVLAPLAAVVDSGSAAVVDLGSYEWTLSNPGRNISVPGRVPSSVHLDLMRANVIGDPYHGLNDFDLRWIVWANWTYQTTLQPRHRASFEFSSEECSSGETSSGYLPESSSREPSQEPPNYHLLFNGLDTFADIDLCGTRVASTNNQFRQYHFDVSRIIQQCKGPRVLSITFGSAAAIAKNISELPGQETWPGGVEGIFEFQHRQFVRKEQNDFGWDWGPAFVPAGIWQPAYLLALGAGDVHVRNTLVDVYREGQVPLLQPPQNRPWVVNASVDVVGRLPLDASMAFTLTTKGGQSPIIRGNFSNIANEGARITGNATIPLKLVDLWWPHNLGAQKLYRLRIDILSKGKTLASVTKTVGFRTIVLNQEPVGAERRAKGIAPGANWHFEINGNEFYAKGSNFIPPDTFWTRVTPERIHRLFDMVVRGNQNMLRIWSSGAYLPDFAYDIADEMGILLWSEFQFGDALYPADAEFLANVREEAQYQVRRINHHPSLALWAGGNEMENLELQQVRSDSQWEKYLKEYEMLFLDVLGVAVFENSRSISYTPSSTSNGWAKLDFSKRQPITQRYYNTTEGEIYGNTDYYNYGYEAAFTWGAYPVGRFSNEFGFHSMPSIQSWRQAVNESDLAFESKVVRLRNHHYPAGGLATDNFDAADRGMDEMTGAVAMYYPTPHKANRAANFSSWCHATQIFQADFYSSQIQFYRRGSGMPERQLGSLYWQLEDIWQASTWAGIEYDGRWKVLHYVAKDRYKPVIISPFFDADTGMLQIYVTSDLWNHAEGTANLTWYDWSGNRLPVQTNSSHAVYVGAINSTKIFETNVTDTLKHVDPKNAVLSMELSVVGIPANSDVSQEYRHANWFHPVALSKAKLVDPQLRLTRLKQPDRFRIEAVGGIAPWVWLDHPAGVVANFDDNGFWLRPGRPVEVGWNVYNGTDGTEGAWLDGVTVESLWNLTLAT